MPRRIVPVVAILIVVLVGITLNPGLGGGSCRSPGQPGRRHAMPGHERRGERGASPPLPRGGLQRTQPGVGT